MENTINIIVVLGYFVPVLAFGYIGYKKARDSTEFQVAGRRLGSVMYTGTMSATTIGGVSTIGGVGLGYQYGLSGMWLVVAVGTGLVVFSLLIARKLSNVGVYTIPEMLEARYSRLAGITGAMVVGFYEVLFLVTQFVGIGTIFTVVFGLSSSWAVVAAGGAVLAYSIAGGMWSISLTDVLQFAVMTLGFVLLLLPLSVIAAGGFSAMGSELPASYFEPFSIGAGTVFTYFLLFCLGILPAQEIWQRTLTARNPEIAKWGGLAAGLYCFVYAVAGALVGIAAKILFPSLSVPDTAFARIATEVLPVGIGGLVVAAALAAVMSTASACLIGGSVVFGNDVYARLFRGRARASVAENRIIMSIVGLVSLIGALFVTSVVAAFTVTSNLLVGALLVPALGAMFWKRATATGALMAIGLGAVTVVILMITQGISSTAPIIFGISVSLVSFVFGSLLAPSLSSQRLEEWENRLKGTDTRDTSSS